MYAEHIVHSDAGIRVCASNQAARYSQRRWFALQRGGGGVLAMCINEHKIQLEFRRFENVVKHCAKM